MHSTIRLHRQNGRVDEALHAPGIFLEIPSEGSYLLDFTLSTPCSDVARGPMDSLCRLPSVQSAETVSVEIRPAAKGVIVSGKVGCTGPVGFTVGPLNLTSKT